jgi:N-acetyl sugar amidotransferase
VLRTLKFGRFLNANNHKMSAPYKLCTRCVMDTSDPEIIFDEQGQCNHCTSFFVSRSTFGYQEGESESKLKRLIEEIKRAGHGSEYDCVIGISGGVDSCYAALKAKELGLRALLVHMDNGWNSDAAVKNIKNATDKLGFHYESKVLNWADFKAVQVGFLRASIVDAELPTDVAIPASLHEVAAQQGVKYIISGGNFATEGILPKSWGCDAKDAKLFRSILERFVPRQIRSFPTFGWQKEMYYKYIKGIRIVYLLDYLPYAKEEAIETLQRELGWVNYGGKHSESKYTGFLQTYILPTKFNVDYRRATYSSQVCMGQMSRKEALAQLETLAYDPDKAEIEKQYVCKKLELSRGEFDAIMALPPKTYRDYPNNEKLLKFIYGAYRWLNNKPLATHEAPAAQRTFFQNSMLAVGRRALNWMALGIVASTVLSFVELAISLFIQLFLKGLGVVSVEVQLPRWIGNLSPSPVQLALGLAGIAVLRAIGKYIVGQSGAVSMEMVNARLRRIAIFEMLLHREERVVSASLTNARMNEYFGKAAWFLFAFADSLANGVQAIGLLCVMVLTSPKESTIALIGLGVMGVVVRRLNHRNRDIAERVPGQLELLSRGIERVARNTMLVRALRTHQQEHARFAASIDAYASYSIDSGNLGNITAALTPFVGTLLIVIIVVTSQSVFHTPSLKLLSFLYLFLRFTQSVSATVQQSSICAQRMPQFKRSVDYVGTFTESEISEAVSTSPKGILIPPKGSNVRLASPPAVTVEHLSFSYPNATTSVLNDLSLDVKMGSQLAIVGTSGSGKSTLLALILGLLKPKSGEVRIDGRPAKEYFADPGVRVGYVGAEAFLLAGTIRDNLLYGAREKHSEAELEEALEKASLLTTVSALPGKLEYPITEEGAGLSAGQKQRLCLARALLGKPHLLILDEASANLDEKTEEEIADSLLQLQNVCTTIVVSHRAGILKYADRIVHVGADGTRETKAS